MSTLKHTCIGPTTDGNFLVVYPTPGCAVQTVSCICRTQSQADSEAMRLNVAQVTQEQAIRWDRISRGMGGAYPILEAQNVR